MKVIIFLAGVAVGFVVGTRAGRGAYENMRSKWQGFSNSDQVKQVKESVGDLAGRAASTVSDTVSDAVGKASDKLDQATGKADSAPTEA
ncbi:hypothetical protein [Leifsonia shinshuensis]